MFDLRYHVASLVAVFLALIIGIVVGVGISGKGFVSDSERSLLNQQIADLRGRLDSATRRSTELARAQRAAQTFVADAYPTLMAGRMAGIRIALVFVGHIDGRTRSLVEQALDDAGGEPPLRVRALKLPVEAADLHKALNPRPALASLATERRVGELGRRLAQEIVTGGDAPLWRLLSANLIEERSGNDGPPVDAVVVARTVPPQSGVTARFLEGLYAGLASSGVPAVGVERTKAADSAVEAFAKRELSTVDDLDTPAGRLALVLLLGGATPGQYGVKQTADDGILPPIAPLAAASG
ncbi:MAG TPA: copper transporter [Gaiellaceae bacterium]|nr:copper transporter [Gaiellaceae bacterium]